jgi:hypothetical protein
MVSTTGGTRFQRSTAVRSRSCCNKNPAPCRYGFCRGSGTNKSGLSKPLRFRTYSRLHRRQKSSFTCRFAPNRHSDKPPKQRIAPGARGSARKPASPLYFGRYPLGPAELLLCTARWLAEEVSPAIHHRLKLCIPWSGNTRVRRMAYATFVEKKYPQSTPLTEFVMTRFVLGREATRAEIANEYRGFSALVCTTVGARRSREQTPMAVGRFTCRSNHRLRHASG